MKQQSPIRVVVTWLTLCLAVGMFVGVGWLLWWTYRTGGQIGGDNSTMSQAAAAAYETSSMGGRKPLPGFQAKSPRGFFISGGRANWSVNAGPYHLHISQPDGSLDYQYQFEINRSGAFTEEDGAFLDFVVDLADNPMDARNSEAPPEVIKKLQDLDLRVRLPIKVAKESAAKCKALWESYVAAGNGPDHGKVGGELVAALAEAGKQAFAANKPDFDAILTRARQIVPEDRERAYRAARAEADKPKPPPPPLPTLPTASQPSSMP